MLGPGQREHGQGSADETRENEIRPHGGNCLLHRDLAFAVPYFTIYRPAAGSPELLGAWRAAFLTLEPGLGNRIRLAMPGLLLPTFVGIGSDAPAHGVATLWLVAALLAVGAIEAARRHGAWVLGLLAGPIALAAITSSLRRYPFGVPRHMTFAAPILVLMMAGAVAWLHARFPARVRGPALALLLLLAAGPAARDDLAGVRRVAVLHAPLRALGQADPLDDRGPRRHARPL